MLVKAIQPPKHTAMKAPTATKPILRMRSSLPSQSPNCHATPYISVAGCNFSHTAPSIFATRCDFSHTWCGLILMQLHDKTRCLRHVGYQIAFGQHIDANVDRLTS